MSTHYKVEICDPALIFFTNFFFNLWQTKTANVITIIFTQYLMASVCFPELILPERASRPDIILLAFAHGTRQQIATIIG